MMIDIHSHILPALDDGAPDMEVSLQMARMAVNDGITHIIVTPHIIPGLYNNDLCKIDATAKKFIKCLGEKGIDLKIYTGADVHIAHDLVDKFNSGVVPSLAASRYFLFEPPHHLLPPRIDVLVQALFDSKLIPILTHPERLTWIEKHYDVFERLVEAGVVVQITAGAVTGRFGRRAKYWSERMLDEGKVDILATDAHNLTSRPPILSEARDAVGKRLGEREAKNMVWDRPYAVLCDSSLPVKTGQEQRPARTSVKPSKKGWFSSWQHGPEMERIS